MGMKITPKPWVIGRNGVHSKTGHDYQPEMEVVMVSGTEEDLKLISKAPDMYEMLMGLRENPAVNKLLMEIEK